MNKEKVFYSLKTGFIDTILAFFAITFVTCFFITFFSNNFDVVSFCEGLEVHSIIIFIILSFLFISYNKYKNYDKNKKLEEIAQKYLDEIKDEEKLDEIVKKYSEEND